jgi:hypothetical protein
MSAVAKMFAVAITVALLALSLSSFAQTSIGSAVQGTRSGSPRCDSLVGAAKDQCMRDENAKTDGSSAETPVPGTGIGTGSISSGSNAGTASRCEVLSGTQKSDCLRRENSATGGAGSADRVGPGSTGMGR